MSARLLTVATANAHDSRMLHHPEGLEPFKENHTDVLLLQEALGYSEQAMAERLMDGDFRLVGFAGEVGLAIAIHNQSPIDVVENKLTILHKPSVVEAALKKLGPKDSHRLRTRGMLSSLLIVGDVPINVATTHPIIFVRALARRKQVQALGQAIRNDENFALPRAIVGGDMNHYPDQWAVDRAAQEAGGLSRVEPGEPTWRISGSRHEWAARMAARLTRRELHDFDGNLDVLLYKGVEPVGSDVIDIESDHRAVIANFEI